MTFYMLQVYIRTKDDNLERDTQTDDIETTSKWTQHPREETTVCGGKEDQKETNTSSKHEGKLSSFLQRTCQVELVCWSYVCDCVCMHWCVRVCVCVVCARACIGACVGACMVDLR